MKNNFECVILDLDGTLFYTGGDITSCINRTLRDYDYPEIEEEECLNHVGGGINNTVSKILGAVAKNDPEYNWDEKFLQEAVEKYKDYYSKHFLDTTRPYPGVEQTLKKLKDKGLNLAVISNKSYEYTIQIVEHFSFDRYFEDVLGGDSLDKKKPDPAPINKILSDTDSRPENTLIVGDTEKDIEAGKAANIRTCAVTYGMRSEEMLRNREPDYVIDEFQSVYRICTNSKD